MSSKAIPVNDPARPCWAFFQSLLGRDITVPTDAAEARTALRALLLEAYQERPYALLRMSLFGTNKGGMRSQMEAFVQAFRVHGSGKRLEGGPSKGVRDRFPTDMPGDWRSATDFLLSQWWVMGDGKRGETRAQKYRELDTNTNEPIRAWLPEMCGVIPYLRARTSHILYAYYENDLVRNRAVSLDQCAQYRLELTDEGQFIRPMNTEIDQDAGLSFEDREEGIQNEDMSLETAEALVLNQELDGMLDPLKNSPDLDVDAHTEQIAKLKGSSELRPDSYGDWPLRYLLGADYNANWAATDLDYQKRHTRDLLEELAEFDADVKSDLPTLLEILKEWEGDTPLVEALPELEESAERNAAAIIGARKMKKETETFRLPGLEDRVEQLTKNPDPIASRSLAFDQVRLGELMDANPKDFDLNTSNRPDLVFLSNQAGEAVDWKLHGEQLNKELKRLAVSFAPRIDTSHKNGLTFYTMALRKWDPSKNLFGTVLTDFTKLLVEVRGAAEKKVAAPSIQETVQVGFGFE